MTQLAQVKQSISGEIVDTKTGEIITAPHTEVRPLVEEPPTATPLDLPTGIFTAALERRKANRQALMEWIRLALVDGTDYGVIQTRRGPSKPSLRKPGSEKICGMLGVTARFPTLADYERAVLDSREIRQAIIRCELHDASGHVVAAGVGARSLGQDGGDLNKALKMAEKSAMIDATLRMAGLSEVFTQDLEDLAGQTQDNRQPAAMLASASEASAQAKTKAEEAPIAKQSSAWRLEARIKELGLNRERVNAWCKRKWGVAHLPELLPSQHRELLSRLPGFAEKASAEEASKEREAIQAEAAETQEPTPEDRAKAERLQEQAKQIRQMAQYADRQAYYQDIRRAEELEAQARALLGVTA